MAEFRKIAKIGDIEPDKGKCFEVDGRRIAVFNLGGSYHAIDDMCTHAEASLSEGEVSGDEIMCPLHFATFNIMTGACTGPPADEDVRSYPVRVTGDDIEVEV
jgi:nitrite reductase/ring-hydroxylating ferredoxin subunit